jgi:putative ABC transport system permease protein
MLKFSIKNAFRKKSIAILASIGVGFGLMLVFVLSAFNAGVSRQFEENFLQVVGQVEVTEKLKQGSESKLMLDFPNDLIATEGIGNSIIAYNVETQLPNYFTLDYVGEMLNDADTLVLIGLNKTLDENYGGATSKLISGRIFGQNKKEIIIDSRLLDVAKFSVNLGDDLEINLNLGGTEKDNLKIVGVYEQEDLGAPTFVPRQYYAYTDIETAWQLLEDAGEETDTYSKITIQFDAKDNDETNLFVEKINNNSEDGLYDPLFVAAYSLGAFFEAIEDTFGIIGAFIGIVGFIATIAGGMAIIVTQLMSVTSRMKEFAILKATGWKNRHIFLNVIYESLTLGLAGALIGLGLGMIFILALSSGTSPFGTASAIVTIEGLIEIIAYALILGVIGGLYPGIKAARVRPVIVLKGD